MEGHTAGCWLPPHNHLHTFECQAPEADIGYKVWNSRIKHHPTSLPLPPQLVQGWLNQTSCQRRMAQKWCWYFTDKLCSQARLGKFCRSELSASLPLFFFTAFCIAFPTQLSGNAVRLTCTRKSTIIIAPVYHFRNHFSNLSRLIYKMHKRQGQSKG